MAATEAEEAPVITCHHQLNDDVVTEILLRLPSTSVLRFRAVSRAWRAITTRPDFLAAHARLRPLELIVAEGLGGALHAVPLDDGLDVDARTIRCLLPSTPRAAHLIAPCDGLLLLEVRGHAINNVERLLVCNPVTRQWTSVPLPRSGHTLTRACGFYLHGPSGEHRLLFLTNDDERGGMGTSASHYVRSLEAGETRMLGPAAATVHMFTLTPRALHHRGNLHWVEHPEAEEAQEILVFDTVQETFRRMPPPPVGSFYDATDLFLLETAQGMLSVAAMRWGCVDIWVMEDYNNGQSWTRRHRIDLPPPLRHVGWVVMTWQNALLSGYSPSDVAVVYDMTEKKVVLKQMQLRCTDHLTGHVFRESLQRHAFFDQQQEQP
ncbi:hypothetical protein HU200_000510 [Digitaria exilis]|uniref:F-box domain-containing protein n=1 Tax=Digitaria exilis TaxID=1010633 RepID=A0A835KWR1_9POAL|nr:hypothetical protein HU200_000510 [Digitaria exilis]